MNETNARRYEMLTRVRNFGTTYGQLFPESSLASEAFAAISAAIDQIQAQDVAARTATASSLAARKQVARRALVERLTKVAATARVIAETNSRLAAHFALSGVESAQALLTTARQFAKDAAPFSAEFVAHGMPPTFLTALQTAIDAFEEALRDRGMSQSERLAANASIRAALGVANAAVRRLDVIVANHTGLDAVVREVWARDRRVGSPRGPARNPGPEAEEALRAEEAAAPTDKAA